MAKKFEIKLGSDFIRVQVINGNGSLVSSLQNEEDEEYDIAIEGLERLILAHACAGVDIESPGYVEGIETAIEAIANQYT